MDTIHTTEGLNELVGENVAVKFKDGQLMSGLLSRSKATKSLLYDLLLSNGIHVELTEDSVEVARRGNFI